MAVKSMTGYGQASVKEGNVAVSVEIRAVNHRFFECVVRAPRDLMMVEEAVRQQVKASFARGRMDVYISLDETSAAGTLSVNSGLLDQLKAAAEEIQAQISDIGPATVVDWLQYPGVITPVVSSVQSETLSAVTLRAVADAVGQLLAMRIREGQRLAEDMKEKVRNAQELTNSIEKRAPIVLKAWEQRLRAKLEEVVARTDESRVMTEVVLMADRMTIDEELTRLRSHITEFHASLQSSSAIGRRLDFIIQEMNREVNTIASKSQDVEIAQTTVNLKAIIEQLREQVQNIE
ncbi:YicC/YloC family endoribonuclease [Alicyclobacillus sp. SO9]|uniref:YicC/YloC family endoribonuclease n=1 Tax=Alicyclobacillus sp. SO9 TaxID=2665646 RepID=UPI0018E72258|nr:YicC/YloC family endoribonuclease [Alicyclobacillus sp. SO9]QQE80731.1 YicC family protein [Alicyclobacillus sp. SO9]